MTDARYQQVKRLFVRACELASDERAAWLAAECAGDADLRREVEALLERDAAPHPLLGEKALGEAFRVPDPAALVGGAAVGGALVEEAAELPQTIGGYRVVELLGQGGMGRVYRAEQASPRREVALKVVRATVMPSKRSALVEREAEALARLQHPGIAQIYEAGMASDDQPYFAMELVEGVPLIDHVRNGALSLRNRLELMVQICDAVHHAHQKGVIHRDLKPGNILVDGSGRPKVLDFGVARITDSDIYRTTMQSDARELVGTLPYMSSEQLSGDPAAVDTRTDVYSLGVVCYELLAGQLPYDLAGKSLPDAVRALERGPRLLGSVEPGLRGDVETIVSRALECDPDRRYPSAHELGEDIGRYLRDEPITARPPSTAYQLSKFARRNRALVGGGVLVLVVLIAGLIATGLALVRARDAESSYQAEARSATALADFLQSIFAAVNPRADGREYKVVEALDRAAARVESEFGGEPVLEAVVRATIGRAFLGLGQLERAEPQLRRALALRSELLGDDDPVTAESRADLGEWLLHSGDPAGARIALERAIAVHERRDGESRTVLEWRSLLALALLDLDQVEDAERLAQAVLTDQRRVLGGDHEDALDTMSNLAAIYFAKNDLAAAEASLRDEMARRLRGGGPGDPGALVCMESLSVVLQETGRLGEARQLTQEALDRLAGAFGDEHSETLVAKSNLATLLLHEGVPAEAEALFRTTVATQERVLGAEHPQLLVSQTGLAVALKRQNKLPEALQLYEHILAVQRRTLGADHADTLITQENLANALRAAGDPGRAAELMRGVLDLRTRRLGAAHPYTIGASRGLAGALREHGDLQGAEAALGAAVAAVAAAYPAAHPVVAETRSQHGASLLALGQLDEAERELTASLRAFEAAGVRDGRARRVVEWLVQVCEKRGDEKGAAAWRARLAPPGGGRGGAPR